MLRPRIIPCLLLQQGALVKTMQFGQPKYVGDPLNAVRIFNEKEVDELMVLDIGATTAGREPDYGLIGRLATECRMPLSYGGGVRTTDQVRRIIGLGVEKVAMSAAAIANPALVAEAAEHVGSQSVAVILDVKRNAKGIPEVFVRNGREGTGMDPISCAKLMEQRGAGEIVLNSIDRDGMMQGYDLDLARRVRRAVHVPMTVIGGAGTLDHVRELTSEFGTIGVAAGSLFVFKGKFRAVLISYPTRAEHDSITEAARGPGKA